MKLKARSWPENWCLGTVQNDAQYSVNGYPNIHLQYLDVKVLNLYSVV